MEAVSGFRLVPVAFLQHVNDQAALQVFHDFKERSIRTMFKHLPR